MLHPYTRDGTYGKYFDAQATIDFSSDFIVLELEELKAKKDLQTVVLLIMMYRITREMYFSRDRKKIVIIDEAWDLLSGGATAEFIEAGYRRARKYKGAFMSATQGVDDYYRNPAAKAALDNSDWMFLLRQKPESIEMMDKLGQGANVTKHWNETLAYFSKATGGAAAGKGGAATTVGGTGGRGGAGGLFAGDGGQGGELHRRCGAGLAGQRCQRQD